MRVEYMKWVTAVAISDYGVLGSAVGYNRLTAEGTPEVFQSHISVNWQDSGHSPIRKEAVQMSRFRMRVLLHLFCSI